MRDNSVEFLKHVNSWAPYSCSFHFSADEVKLVLHWVVYKMLVFLFYWSSVCP